MMMMIDDDDDKTSSDYKSMNTLFPTIQRVCILFHATGKLSMKVKSKQWLAVSEKCIASQISFTILTKVGLQPSAPSLVDLW